jgi:ribosomal protein S27AE
MAKTKKREKYNQVDVIPSACPKCHCTDREPYFAIKRLETYGVTPAGREYTRVTFKRTRCKRCGQARVDRVFESPADSTES